MEMWHTTPQAPLDIYEGDRFVCQCSNLEDARTIVAAVNKMGEYDKRVDALNQRINHPLYGPSPFEEAYAKARRLLKWSSKQDGI